MRRKIIALLATLNAVALVLASFGLGAASKGGRTQFQTLQTPTASVADAPQLKTRQLFLPILRTKADNAWSTAGANPARTSWTREEVRGKLKPLWYKPFEPYIPLRVQIITSYDTLYISTSQGLYALDATTGAEKWVYGTKMPLGHSPTIYNKVAYVGGFDRRLHAVDAITGQGLWTFEAGAGFDTNPLAVGDKVYAGNRDGFFYAVYTQGSQAGKLAWKFQTQGPIHFSAAYSNGVVYFASDDSYAYALDSQSGDLVWKSDKLLGAGFHSWWPVVYRDTVIFAGSQNYRHNSMNPGEGLKQAEEDEIFPNRKADPRGTLAGPNGTEPGDWIPGTPTIDMSRSTVTSNGSTRPVTEYFEEKPWRRTYFVLDRNTGEEVTYDFDGDGKPEYAPILWMGTGSGNRYPPVVGGDGVIYQTNKYLSDPNINGGQVSGWKIGTPFISVVNSDWGAKDEPHAYSAGGNLIYWNLCCDRQAGAVDIGIPNTQWMAQYQAGNKANAKGEGVDRTWSYFGYNLPQLIPGYNRMTYVWDPYYKPDGGVYGGRNGSYGWHGDVNPPIPYQGKVYMHRSNAIIAFAPQAGKPLELPVAKKVNSEQFAALPVGQDQVKARLVAEVQRILDAGHLRPGYSSTGIFNHQAQASCGDNLTDYWHQPGETIVTLLGALPHLPSSMQEATKRYIQSEFAAFPPTQYTHIGWKDGAPREAFILPPDVEADRLKFAPRKEVFNFEDWKFNPYAFYAMWKYAQAFGGAQGILDASNGKLGPVPSDQLLAEKPHVHNAFIAGYLGYLELQKLAGKPESPDIRNQLNRLLSLRASSFTKDLPQVFFDVNGKAYCRSLAVARNFIYLVPELAQYLHDNANAQVQQALTEYYQLAPLWFVSKAEVALGEGVINHFFDYYAIYQARARILKEPASELSRYLDVPAVAVGDLFYIQNLVATLEAGG